MGDKRRHKRLSVNGVYGNVLFASKAQIINVSLGGAAVQITKNLALGREYSIKFETDGREMEIKGTVVWSVLKGSQKGAHGDVIPLYHVGIRFDDALAGKTSELVKFIDSHKMKGADERLRGIRFKIHSAENTVLYYPSSYKVKLISPFGMLIETLQPLKPEDRFPMEMSVGGGKSIRFTGRITSCTEVSEKQPIHYDVGVEFLHLNEEDKPALDTFIRDVYAGEKETGK